MDGAGEPPAGVEGPAREPGAGTAGSQPAGTGGWLLAAGPWPPEAGRVPPGSSPWNGGAAGGPPWSDAPSGDAPWADRTPSGPVLDRMPDGGYRRPPRRQGRLARIGASALAALAKIKVLLVAGSVLVSLAAYGLAFGWKFGALLLLILAVHETGHTVAIRSRGLPASLPVFIPFLGALINLRRRPRDAAEEAYIAAAGPLFGLGASYALLALRIALRVPVLAVAAGFGMLIHVFNLLPVTPLDGGRTVAFLRWKAWIPGFLALLVLLFYSPQQHAFVMSDPLAPIILAFIIYNVAMEARRRPPAGYDAIGARLKWTYGALWLGMLLLAGAGYVLAPRPGLV